MTIYSSKYSSLFIEGEIINAINNQIRSLLNTSLSCHDFSRNRSELFTQHLNNRVNIFFIFLKKFTTNHAQCMTVLQQRCSRQGASVLTCMLLPGLRFFQESEKPMNKL